MINLLPVLKVEVVEERGRPLRKFLERAEFVRRRRLLDEAVGDALVPAVDVLHVVAVVGRDGLDDSKRQTFRFLGQRLLRVARQHAKQRRVADVQRGVSDFPGQRLQASVQLRELVHAILRGARVHVVLAAFFARVLRVAARRVDDLLDGRGFRAVQQVSELFEERHERRGRREAPGQGVADAFLGGLDLGVGERHGRGAQEPRRRLRSGGGGRVRGRLRRRRQRVAVVLGLYGLVVVRPENGEHGRLVDRARRRLRQDRVRVDSRKLPRRSDDGVDARVAVLLEPLERRLDDRDAALRDALRLFVGIQVVNPQPEFERRLVGDGARVRVVALEEGDERI